MGQAPCRVDEAPLPSSALPGVQKNSVAFLAVSVLETAARSLFKAGFVAPDFAGRRCPPTVLNKTVRSKESASHPMSGREPGLLRV